MRTSPRIVVSAPSWGSEPITAGSAGSRWEAAARILGRLLAYSFPWEANVEAAYQAALAFRLTEMGAGGSRWPDRPPQVLLGVFTAAAPDLLVAAVGPYRKHAPLFIKDGTFGQRRQEFARREPASGPLLEDVGWQDPDKLVNSAPFLVVGHRHHH